MTRSKFATDTALQVTLREMQSDMAKPPLWIGLAAVGAILGLSGPFGTDEVMRAVPRLAYWAVVVVLTYVSGSFMATFISQFAQRRGWPKWPAVVLAGTCAGIVISGELAALNFAIFGPASVTAPTVLAMLGNVIAISIIVSAAFAAVPDQPEPDAAPQGQAAAAAREPAILTRLPLDKRGALISISVQDHYVDVVTEKGTEMLLMRLGDAISQTAPTAGLQVHRSHWVATSQVKSVRRDGAKAILTLSDGRDLPASRTYIPALKDAGLLPK